MKEGMLMDRIAIISDIHANLTALETVFDDINKRNINKIICLGDIIFKGVSPAECIDLIREKCDVVIKGNCDEIMTDELTLKKKYWTRMQIGEKRTEYLRNLPVCHEFYLSGYLVRLFHACPDDLKSLYNPMFSNKNSKNESREITDVERMFRNTEFIGKSKDDKVPDIVGYGHIHTPNILRFKDKMIFNPGSVGMPVEMMNDNKVSETSRFSTVSSYIILDGELDKEKLGPISVQLVRIPYDIEKEIARAKKSDNPEKEDIIRKLQTAEP
ncbi:MAG: metallophosphoesterase family protein [Clostridia bacterium]|nr:metallophosphoesterase family protein [Clostridia bacterium]